MKMSERGHRWVPTRDIPQGSFGSSDHNALALPAAERKRRILFLADRNVLIDQTMVNDFRPFGAAMAKFSTKAKTIDHVSRAE